MVTTRRTRHSRNQPRRGRNRHEPDAVFKAIADPTRREILRLLRTEERTVSHIAENFSTSRPAISKHLRLLRSAGLVITESKGAARLCRLNAGPLRVVNDWIREYEIFWTENLQSLKHYVEQNLREENR